MVSERAQTVLEAIKSRRTVREFTSEPVSEEALREILEAGRWAPSGKNTQPWRFIVVKDEERRAELARLTSQEEMIRSAPVCIAVLLDHKAGYNRDKDMQGIGACVQNMCLAAHALGLGACWVGGITGRRAEAERLLGVGDDQELVLLLVIGHPRPGARERTSTRLPLEELLVREL